jgi:hypothetical protein
MKKTRTIFLTAAVTLIVVSNQGFGDIYFNDGATHNVNYEVPGCIWVDYQTANAQTNVNLLSDCWMTGTMFAYNNSQVTMSGGIATGLRTYDNSKAIVSGGSLCILQVYNYSQMAISDVGFMELQTYDNGHVTISGDGCVSQAIANGSSKIEMSNGTIGEFVPLENSQVVISGGVIFDFAAYGNSQTVISGGSVMCFYALGNSNVVLSGGKINAELEIKEAATLTISGYNFAIDGIPVGYGEITSLFGNDTDFEPERQLSGVLANGDVLDNIFVINNNAKIILIPEPVSAVVMTLGGLLFALRQKTRSKKQPLY